MAPALDHRTVGELLAGTSMATRQRLETVLLSDGFEGVIGADVVGDLGRLESTSTEQMLLELVPLAAAYAAPATSGFPVGAVCEGGSGNAYLGANLELPGVPPGFTVHAEQSAVASAIGHGEKAARRLAVSAPPCGHCRQFLNELSGASALEVIVAGRPATTLASLLPQSFGPWDLGVGGGLSGQTETPLTRPPGISGALAEAALRAASLSYAPYTRALSGVALRLTSGAIVAGSYMENAAFNPSLPPVLAAIDRVRFRAGRHGDIAEAMLIELEDAKVRQEGITRLLLESIAPGIPLRVAVVRPVTR